MKIKVLTSLLILTSLFGYLEWGTDNHSFLFEGEWEVLNKLFTNPKSVAHPFTFIPILGQILLFITLFQKMPNKKLMYTGIACLSLLLAFMLVAGILSSNVKIMISTLPFLISAFFTIRHLRNI